MHLQISIASHIMITLLMSGDKERLKMYRVLQNVYVTIYWIIFGRGVLNIQHTVLFKQFWVSLGCIESGYGTTIQ